MLFGAVVLAVAMDVLIQQLQKRSRLNRPQALILVLLGLALAGTVVATLLLPELVVQIQQLGKDLPQLVEKLTSLLSADPRLSQLEDNLSSDVNFSKLQPIGPNTTVKMNWAARVRPGSNFTWWCITDGVIR